ncbi:MAG: hypothetical protein NTZ68_02465 [Candidatus Dependentiae bacterium]|nr:hypothetical protein [Candidatus Dependentiae bacterium]
MSTNKKLSLIALATLMSSVALPTGRGGAASNPMVYSNRPGSNRGGIFQNPGASDVYSAGPHTTDSFGPTQPVYLDASDIFSEQPGPFILDATATPILGKDGGGVQKKQTQRLGRDGHGIWKKDSPKARQCRLTKDFNNYSSALLEVANYRTKVAKYNIDVCKNKKRGGMQVKGYDKYRDALTTIKNYENPVAPTSNEIIA